MADCAEILKAYGKLAATAVKGKEAAASAPRPLEDIAAKLPERAARRSGGRRPTRSGSWRTRVWSTGATALTTTEFVEANKSILGYLREDCLPG